MTTRFVAGGDESSVVLPMPNCPRELLPQHRTPNDPDITTHVLRVPQPVPRDSTPDSTADDGGLDWFTVLPVPSCPLLLEPQQNTPLSFTAHVWEWPVPIAVAPLSIAATGGETTSISSPFPSWPRLFAPQQYTPLSTPRMTHVCHAPVTIDVAPVTTSVDSGASICSVFPVPS